MSQETFWVLLSKKLSGEATVAELKELEHLISTHPEWQYAIQNLEDLWKHPPKEDQPGDEDAYMLHLHRMTELNIPFGDGQDEPPASRGRKVSMKKWYWAAAAIVFFAIAGFVWINNNKGEIKEEAIAQSNEVSTRRGSKSTVHLPDGTIVVLNAGSKLTYNKDFGKELREVTLSGEGFFDVKRMSQKPFVIHTESINIKVLGTVFNVKAYPEDKRTETSLIHGSIEVTMKNRPNDKIILAPSEKLVVENNTVVDKTVTTTKGTEIPEVSINTLMSVNKLRYNEADSSVAETGWVDNKLVFRDESFEDLVRKMERWYDVDIEISDARLREKRLNGTFEKETIDQALEALKILSPFRYEQTGNKIIIHR
ncbi:MAG TPA: FecR family protein [Chitinophagaceae bacterium]|jgi:ferric-dicitrate binding protein FerR (iron transport regulator)|nr:FecR family protein [Chitinophagaceae bacterium]